LNALQRVLGSALDRGDFKTDFFGNPFLGSANMLQKRCGCGIAETSLGFGKAQAFEGGLIETNGFDFFNAVFKNW